MGEQKTYNIEYLMQEGWNIRHLHVRPLINKCLQTEYSAHTDRQPMIYDVGV